MYAHVHMCVCVCVSAYLCDNVSLSIGGAGHYWTLNRAVKAIIKLVSRKVLKTPSEQLCKISVMGVVQGV